MTPDAFRAAQLGLLSLPEWDGRPGEIDDLGGRETAGPYRLTTSIPESRPRVFHRLAEALGALHKAADTTGLILEFTIECRYRRWTGEQWPYGGKGRLDKRRRT